MANHKYVMACHALAISVAPFPTGAFDHSDSRWSCRNPPPAASLLLESGVVTPCVRNSQRLFSFVGCSSPFVLRESSFRRVSSTAGSFPLSKKWLQSWRAPAACWKEGNFFGTDYSSSTVLRIEESDGQNGKLSGAHQGERWAEKGQETARNVARSHSGDSGVQGNPGSLKGPEFEKGLFTPYVEYCIEQLSWRMELSPFPMEEQFRQLVGSDGRGQVAVSRSTSLQSPKLRQIRAADISAGPGLQVLNLILFPRPELDLPFFCADLVALPRGYVVVLDLNPLFNTEEYLSRYIRPMMHLAEKYFDTLPWGGELTSEAIQFFSPAVIWSRPPSGQVAQDIIFSAFKDYLQAWLALLETTEPSNDPLQIARNREAQHRYLCWRAEKDPGRPVLTKLFGETLCESYIHDFLFDGLLTLGEKKFLDYFPEYRTPDGGISKKRSMQGKAYPSRPWDGDGKLVL